MVSKRPAVTDGTLTMTRFAVRLCRQSGLENAGDQTQQERDIPGTSQDRVKTLIGLSRQGRCRRKPGHQGYGRQDLSNTSLNLTPGACAGRWRLANTTSTCSSRTRREPATFAATDRRLTLRNIVIPCNSKLVMPSMSDRYSDQLKAASPDGDSSS